MTVGTEHSLYCVRCNKDITDDDLKLYDRRNLAMLKFYGFCVECQRIIFDDEESA